GHSEGHLAESCAREICPVKPGGAVKVRRECGDAAEGRPAEPSRASKGRLVEPGVAGEGRPAEPGVAGEGHLVEPRVAGKGHPVEPRVAGEGSPVKQRNFQYHLTAVGARSNGQDPFK